MTRWLAALALAMPALLMFAPDARAHASLVASQPPDGAALDQAPGALSLSFDEPVDPLQVALIDASGTRVPVGPPRVDGTTVQIGIVSPLPRGSYLLSYRVVSLDSHPVSGSIAFGVGVTPDEATTRADAAPPAAAPAIVLRALRDLALLASAGGALFLLVFGRFPGDRRLLAAASVATLALTLATTALQGALLAGTPGAFTPQAFGAAMSASYGRAALVTIAGALLVLLGTWKPIGRAARGALLLGALATIASLTLTGHAAAAQPRAAAAAVVAVHAAAACFWAGALLPLYALLRGDAARAADALQRFSRIAVWAVPALAIAGAAFATLQLGTPAMLVESDYGHLVLAKLGLLGVLVAIAAANRVRLTPRLVHAVAEAKADADADLASRAAARLSATVVAEMVLVAGVLAVTAVLVQTPPHAAAWQRTLQAAGGERAELVVRSTGGGRRSVELSITDAAGKPLDAAAVELTLANAAAGVAPFTRALQPTAPGRYVYRGPGLGFSGTWSLVVRARIDDFDELRWTTEAALP